MKKIIAVVLMISVAASFGVAGCGGQKAASSRDAITKASVMQTVKAKTDYLVGQAKAFYNSKEFQNAIDVATYVITYLDKESKDAKAILEKARKGLAAEVKKGAGTIRKSFAGMLKK